MLSEIQFDFWVVLTTQTGVELNKFYEPLSNLQYSLILLLMFAYVTLLNRNYNSNNCMLHVLFPKRGENRSRGEESNFSREGIAQILNKTEILGQS